MLLVAPAHTSQVDLPLAKGLDAVLAQPGRHSVLLGRHSELIKHAQRRPLKRLSLGGHPGDANFLVRGSLLSLLSWLLLRHLTIHQIVDKPLTSVQISPQIIADLDQTISFLLESSDLAVSLADLCLQIAHLSLLLFRVLPVICPLVLLVDSIFYLFNNRLHINLHLFNHFLKCLVLLLD